MDSNVIPEGIENSEIPPKHRKCGTMQVHERLVEDDPMFRRRLLAIERSTLERRSKGVAERTTPYKIPVVVHVVYTDEASNISGDQIHSQIAVLNQDFRATNSDLPQVPSPWTSLVADAMINFALASTDPDGNPTSGITRTRTDVAAFGTNDRVKSSSGGGINPWPTDRYLNIWVCTLRGGLLGYAQFPDGPRDTDGVVILNTAFGTVGTASAPFNLGRTTTHEVGHFLNLRHIWGDTDDCSGSDLVADTPNAATANYGTPTFPHVSCSNGPDGDMFVNYMDYVDDAAMFMFTRGQVARMHATLEGPRSSLG